MATVTARRKSTTKKKAVKDLKVGKARAGTVRAGTSWLEAVAKALGRAEGQQSK